MKIDLSRFHKRAIDIAVREGLLLDKTQCTIAFVLDWRGRLMKEGWNSLFRTHPLQKEAGLKIGNEHKVFLHAETHAISKVRHRDLKKMSGIVVLRLNRNHQLMLAKPCTCCTKMLKNYSIDTIVHS